MKTKKRKSLLVLLLFTPAIMYSQSAYYYHAGQKVPLTIDSNKVSILSKPGTELLLQKTGNETKEERILQDKLYEIRVIELGQETEVHTPNKIAVVKTSIEKAIQTPVIILPVYRSARSTELISTHYLNVRLKRAEDIDWLDTIAKRYRLQKVRAYEYLPLWYTLSITPETRKNTVEVANEIYETGRFASSYPDLSQGIYLSNVSEPEPCVSEPDFDKQWGLRNESYPGIDISACQAWSLATGKGVNIAIVDNGIDKAHPDLSANIHPLSYDTETGTLPSQLYGDHGTHCAGIAAAALNGQFVAGVAPEAKLMAVSNQLNAVNTSIEMASGINWAWKNGADILSCSWATNANDALEEAIDSALLWGRNGKGAILVFASGNYEPKPVNEYDPPVHLGNGPSFELVNYDSSVMYPAKYRPDILTVGSINRNGVRSFYSCYGNELDVCAPGDTIYSTLPRNSIGINFGTSMACPHVSGIAALMLERNPTLTGQEVRDIIERNTKKVGGLYRRVPARPNGAWSEEYGYGLADAYAAVRAVQPCTTTEFVNQIVTTDITVRGCNVIVRDVMIKNGAKLIIDAENETLIEGVFEAEIGSEFEIK